jgi:pimeloyl-ACP methyl ester carboxylesterase
MTLLEWFHQPYVRTFVRYERFLQGSWPYLYDTFAADLHTLMTQLDLRKATLVGYSMGTGEVAHYLGTYGSDRLTQAVFVSPIPPFLLKTADNPEGVDGSIFDAIMQSVAADRFVYLTQFFHDFYNLDVTLGKRARIDSIGFRREAFSARSAANSASTRAVLARSRASSISSCTIRSSAVIALF